MLEKKVEVSEEGLSRLQSAAQDFARPECDRIVHAVIKELQSRSAEGVFGDVHARHLWDEYCWALQEGKFDIEMGIGDANFESLSNSFEEILSGVIAGEIEALPKPMQVFLSALAIEEGSEGDEDEWLGRIWTEGVVRIITQSVNDHASKRNLSLIGPDREDAIAYDIEGTGFVWSVLDSDLTLPCIANHADSIFDPAADLSRLVEDLIEVFLENADRDGEILVFQQFFKYFESSVRRLIKEDTEVALQEMRRGLLRVLEG